MNVGAEFVFGLVALGGLLAALRPDAFADRFLAKWQRERLQGNVNARSWTGWVIFGTATVTLVAMVIEDILKH